MSDYICQELIVEIFTRLPPKSLLRFRSLSKSLCSCISSPDFIRTHTFQSPQKILFLHSDSDPESQPIYTLHEEDELPLCLSPNRGYIGITTKAWFPRSPRFRTIGSCNGTFCLRTGTNLTLWNPSIRRKLCVPKFPRSSELNRGAIGFGFDSINDDYKIAWVSHTSDICSFVYAVKTGTWCEIASPKPEFTWLICEGFFFNGVLHWAGFYYDIESPYIRLSCILAFDLSTHVFGNIPSPGPTSEWMIMELTAIQDSLASISYCQDVDTWIWVWRDASWSPVFKLGTGQLIIYSALQLQPQPNNNGDLLLINICWEGYHVYSPTTGVRSSVVDFDAGFRFGGFCWCVETLHLLDIGEIACETNQQ